jgi:hypothetical protein
LTRPAPPALPEATREQIVFAAILRAGTGLSMTALVAGFLLYIGGLVPPLVPIAELPRYWGLSAPRYLAATGLPRGWGWVALVRHGDILNFLGIAMLAGLTIVCYLAVLPAFLRKGDTVYSAIVVLELAVLLLAASGLVVAGH